MKKSLSVKPNTSLKNKTGGWRTFRPVVTPEKCIGCTLCAKLCPDATINMILNADNKAKAQINYDYCKGCGVCASECPVKAIAMEKEIK
ncbi:MAG: 4Fe-4S dicluster-binding protein [Candidatus Falkowbacteria bacterium]